MNTTLKTVLILGGLMLVGTYGARKLLVTRGIRNNNPGNIKHFESNSWHGKTGVDPDGFVIFGDAADGIDAIGEIIDSYRNRGVVTVRQIIETYAPAEGRDANDVESYIAHVQQLTGWQSYHMPTRFNGGYLPLIKAIIKHENGQNPYSDQFIEDALNRAT